MAYPVVCEPCLRETHDCCIEQDATHLAARQEAMDQEIAGGPFCVCPTCKKWDNTWSRSIYSRDLATLQSKDASDA